MGALIAHRVYKFNPARPLVYAGFNVFIFVLWPFGGSPPWWNSLGRTGLGCQMGPEGGLICTVPSQLEGGIGMPRGSSVDVQF